jgi:hypothetical protein
MRTPDLDRARSEEMHSLPEFLKLYNQGLPEGFMSASSALLEEYKETHGGFSKGKNSWSLDLHRKKVMDWLRARQTTMRT